ncbi:MAG: sulfatase [Planctomycetales bacterium]|nr:sulfatase [Planctomycetales bacterium]
MNELRIGWAATLFLFLVASAATLPAAERGPNVILFIGDDISWNDFGCYGNQAARTPNIDRLASRGLVFTQAYLTASSCSPSRSSIITGRYPHNNGKAAELHLPIAANLPWFPELLREAGYYTALSGKHHMSVRSERGQPARPQAFDHVDPGRGPGNGGGHANWVQVVRERPKDKPFFFWFASYDAHRGWDADNQWDAQRYGPKHRPEDVIVPPFLIDDAATRSDLASYYNEVTRYDHYIGLVVDELKAQGELENTLILVMADNGRPFPRAKTRLHDSGMKTALVAHWPRGIRSAGAECDSLVSAIDIAPTILQLAGANTPKTFQGESMSPIFSDPTAAIRRFAYSEHNWHDYEALGRCVRSADGFLYIRNFRPQQAWQGPADSVRSPSHRSLQRMRDEGKLAPAQTDVFLTPRAEVELYRTADDADQLHSLADDPAYDEIEAHLAETLAAWRDATGDSAPERISADSFDRETGNSLRVKENEYRGTTPGEDRSAEKINARGPH